MKRRLTTFLQEHAWLLFSVLVLALFLGTRGFNEPDEGRYAEIAREMATSGNWLVPTLNGFDHFQKPPFLYWCTALSLRTFGHNEWAGRLPSALAGLGVVCLTYLIGRKLFSAQTGRNAAVILVSGLEFFALARLLTPDMTMSLWIVAAIAAFVHRDHWCFFIAMGLGFLTKGPMALVVPLAAAITWHWSTRGTADWRPVPWARGLLLTLLIALSWFILLSVWRAELFAYFWKYELVQRFGSNSHGRSQPWWFFLPVLLLGLMPWTFLLPGMARRLWQRYRSRAVAPQHLFLLGWAFIPLLILSCSGSKLLTYVLPLLPAFAIAAAAFLQSTRLTWKIAIPAAAVWIAVVSNSTAFSPLMGRQVSIKPLALLLEAQPDSESALLFTCGVRTHGFAFYTNELVSTTRGDADIVLPLDTADAARVFKNVARCASELTGGPRAYGIVDEDRFQANFKPKGWRSLGQEGGFLLITNDQVSTVAVAR